MATGGNPPPLLLRMGEGVTSLQQSTVRNNKLITPPPSSKPPPPSTSKQTLPSTSKPTINPNHLQPPCNLSPPIIYHPQPHEEVSNTVNSSPKIDSSQLEQSADATHSLPKQRSFLEVLKGCSSKGEASSVGLANSQAVEMESFDLKPTSLYKGKPAVVFSTSEKQALVDKLKYVLVGKFSHGMPSLVKTRNFFNALKLFGSCIVSSFDKKHIFIECSCKSDYNYIWMQLTWAIDGFVMRVFKWTADFHPVRESAVVPAWIRLEGLPLYFFDELSLMKIAYTIGKPLKVDPRNVARTMVNSARICVELDLSKPLMDSMWISFEDEVSKEVKEGFWARVFYDVVPQFCVFCSHLGHSAGRCKRMMEQGLALSSMRVDAGVHSNLHDTQELMVTNCTRPGGLLGSIATSEKFKTQQENALQVLCSSSAQTTHEAHGEQIPMAVKPIDTAGISRKAEPFFRNKGHEQQGTAQAGSAPLIYSATHEDEVLVEDISLEDGEIAGSPAAGSSVSGNQDVEGSVAEVSGVPTSRNAAVVELSALEVFPGVPAAGGKLIRGVIFEQQNINTGAIKSTIEEGAVGQTIKGHTMKASGMVDNIPRELEETNEGDVKHLLNGQGKDNSAENGNISAINDAGAGLNYSRVHCHSENSPENNIVGKTKGIQQVETMLAIKQLSCGSTTYMVQNMGAAEAETKAESASDSVGSPNSQQPVLLPKKDGMKQKVEQTTLGAVEGSILDINCNRISTQQQNPVHVNAGQMCLAPADNRFEGDSMCKHAGSLVKPTDLPGYNAHIQKSVVFKEAELSSTNEAIATEKTTSAVVNTASEIQLHSIVQGLPKQTKTSANSWAVLVEEEEQDEDSEEDDINGTLADLHKQVMGLKSSKEGHLVEEEVKKKSKKQDIRITSQLSPSEVKDWAKKEIAKLFSSPTSTLPSITNLHIPDKDGNSVPISEIIEKSEGVSELSKDISKMRDLDENLKGEHGLELLRTSGGYDQMVTWYTIVILQTLKDHSQTSFYKDSTTDKVTPLDQEVVKKRITLDDQEWTTPKRRGRDRNKKK